MEEWSPAIVDPATVLLGFAALCGLLAAWYWWRVSSSVDTSGDVVRGPDKRSLSTAAFLTSLTLALASAGYLLGRLSGSF